MWTARGTMLRNKLHLVTFHECILVSLWSFQPTLGSEHVKLIAFSFTFQPSLSFWMADFSSHRQPCKLLLRDLYKFFMVCLRDGHFSLAECFTWHSALPHRQRFFFFLSKLKSFASPKPVAYQGFFYPLLLLTAKNLTLFKLQVNWMKMGGRKEKRLLVVVAVVDTLMMIIYIMIWTLN